MTPQQFFTTIEPVETKRKSILSILKQVLTPCFEKRKNIVMFSDPDDILIRLLMQIIPHSLRCNLEFLISRRIYEISTNFIGMKNFHSGKSDPSKFSLTDNSTHLFINHEIDFFKRLKIPLCCLCDRLSEDNDFYPWIFINIDKECSEHHLDIHLTYSFDRIALTLMERYIHNLTSNDIADVINYINSN